MGSSIPQVGDLNGDGIKDIVASDYFSNIHFFEGIDDKNYKASTKFKMSDGSDLEIAGAAKNGSGINDGGVYGGLTMNDWNEDGLIDILFTARHCPLIVFYNEGEDGAPVFGDPDTIKIGGNLYLDDRPGLAISDINLDGKKDLILGRDKIVSFSLNVGTNSSPEFDEVSNATKNNGEEIYMNYGAGVAEAHPIHGETQVAVVDWNNDGYPDLLVGENTGWTIGGPLEYLFLFLGVPDGSVNSDVKMSDCKVHYNDMIKFNGINKSIDISSLNLSMVTMNIYSVNGKIIGQYFLNDNFKEVTLEQFAKGSYFVSIRSRTVNLTQKILIN